MTTLAASSPPGWEDTTERMKDHPEIDNPFALSWWMHNKGIEPQACADKSFMGSASKVYAACSCDGAKADGGKDKCSCEFPPPVVEASHTLAEALLASLSASRNSIASSERPSDGRGGDDAAEPHASPSTERTPKGAARADQPLVDAKLNKRADEAAEHPVSPATERTPGSGGGGSYFKDCPRDEGGHCSPGGGVAAQTADDLSPPRISMAQAILMAPEGEGIVPAPKRNRKLARASLARRLLQAAEDDFFFDDEEPMGVDVDETAEESAESVLTELDDAKRKVEEAVSLLQGSGRTVSASLLTQLFPVESLHANRAGKLDHLYCEAIGGLIVMASRGVHPNKIPFKALLHPVDTASARPPSGSGGHLVLIPRIVAERQLGTLVGMGINVGGFLAGHDVKRKIGVITAASIDVDPDPSMLVPMPFNPREGWVMIAGWLYGKDFPDEVRAIQGAASAGLIGTSYEVSDVMVRNPMAHVWVVDDMQYTGAAALRADAAAYDATQLAAQSDGSNQGGHMPFPPKQPGGGAPHPAAAPPQHMQPQMQPMQPQMQPMQPQQPMQLDPAITQAIQSAITAVMAPIGQRMQAMEQTLAALAGSPGDNADGLALREQANQAEQQVQQLQPQMMQQREQLQQFRAEGKEDEAAKVEQELEKLEAQATELRAKSLKLRAEAYGLLPMAQIMAQLITDQEVSMRKLVTDMGAKVDKVKKLITDGGVGGAPGQGGPKPTPPIRKTMSAAAAHVVGKFDDAAIEKGLSESQIDQALAAQPGLTPGERIGIKLSLQARP